MSITTAGDIINKVFNKTGITSLAAGETPTAAQSSAALDDLNMMLSAWAARRLTARALTQLNHALTVNVASYAIGTGAVWNTPTPYDLESAFYRDADDNDYDVEIITREEYDSYGDKAISTGPPETVFFDPGATQQATRAGTVYVYPIPDVSTYTLYVEATVPFTSFASLTATYTFPGEYLEAIVYNLAVRVATDAGREIPAAVAMLATESFNTIVRLNSPRLVARPDLPYRSGGGNIMTWDEGTD